MFLCAMARGVRYGWFDIEQTNIVVSCVRRAWKDLAKYVIDRQGNLHGVCKGSGWSYDRSYYASLWWNFNDTHGTGIVMLAGTEYDKIEKYPDGIEK